MQKHTPLDGLLEVCDQLRELQNLTSRGARPNEDFLQRTRLQVEALPEQVFSCLPGLEQNPAAANLEPQALLILALLFHGKVSGITESLSGATLCSLLLRAEMSRSETLSLLGPDGILRLQHWVLCEETIQGFDPLDSYFRPSALTLSLFWPTQSTSTKDFTDPSSSDGPTPETRDPAAPFRDESEYLWSIGAWRQICVQRAVALFETDPLAESAPPRLLHLREVAHAKWIEIRQRLAVTPGSRNFGLERLAATHKLGPDHILIIAHLLFAETLDAELFLSPGECLRLIADHRDDLLCKRRMISPQGRLRGEGIVLADGEESAKMLAVPLCLADWVLESVLADVGRSMKWNQQELEEFLRGENEH